MPLVSIREVRGWHKMRLPVFNRQGSVMLGAGTLLTRHLALQLSNLGFQWVDVCDRELPDRQLKTALPNALRSEALQVLHATFDAVRDLYPVDRADLERARLHSTSPAYVRERFLRPASRTRDPGSLLGVKIVDLTYRIGDAVASADVPVTLPFGSNRNHRTSLAAHSLDVALTAGMLARDFGYERDEAARIVLGAMFHDIGYAFFPEDWFIGPQEDAESRPSTEILERARRLHPVLGYLVLKDQRVIDLLASHVAYQHHEHQDGSGFPRGMKGVNRVLTRQQALRSSSSLIHRYANIVSVANVYDRLLGSPPVGFGLPPQEAAVRLRAVAGTHLNRAVVSGLLASVPPFPVASDVWVTGEEYDGFKGVVVLVRRRRMRRPVVRLVFNRDGKRIRPIEVDLNQEPIRLSAEPPMGGGFSSAPRRPSTPSVPVADPEPDEREGT